jgi:hypothetical protein
VPEALRDADCNQISRPAELQSEDRSRGMTLARAL